MSQPYLGEIRMFAGTFSPRGNSYCQGQLINISQNSALFSLLGTTYGGNGTTNFGLPDFQGRLPICMGQGAGLSNYTIGQMAGTESVTLQTTQIPSHTHLPLASTTAAASATPGGQIPATLAAPFKGFYVQDSKKTGSPVGLRSNAVQTAGGNQPHENRMPALTIAIIIALQGIFPSRN
jgi:microcystin-dependent protein